MNIDAKILKILPTESKNTLKIIIHQDQVGIFPTDAEIVQYMEIHQCNPLHKQTHRTIT